MADDRDWRTATTRGFILVKTVEGIGEDLQFTTVVGFDAVLKESHSSELEVTENPVETGIVVSDHAFMKPLRVEIEGAVGNVWLHAKDANGASVKDLFEGESRSAAAWKYLQDLQSVAEPFKVQTGLRLYTNMVITSLSADQDASSAGILIFRASLREVIRVTTKTVIFPPKKVGKPKRQADKPKSGGEIASTPANDSQLCGTVMSSTPDKTAAKALIESLGAEAKTVVKAMFGGGG